MPWKISPKIELRHMLKEVMSPNANFAVTVKRPNIDKLPLKYWNLPWCLWNGAFLEEKKSMRHTNKRKFFLQRRVSFK